MLRGDLIIFLPEIKCQPPTSLSIPDSLPSLWPIYLHVGQRWCGGVLTSRLHRPPQPQTCMHRSHRARKGPSLTLCTRFPTPRGGTTTLAALMFSVALPSTFLLSGGRRRTGNLDSSPFWEDQVRVECLPALDFCYYCCFCKWHLSMERTGS